MYQLEFYKKYYTHYYDLEVAYCPDWLLSEERFKNMGVTNLSSCFNNGKYSVSGVSIPKKDGSRKYRRFEHMTRQQIKQFEADCLSGL